MNHFAGIQKQIAAKCTKEKFCLCFSYLAENQEKSKTPQFSSPLTPSLSFVYDHL